MRVSGSERVALGKNRFKSLAGSRQGHNGAAVGGCVPGSKGRSEGDESLIRQATTTSNSASAPAAKMTGRDISIAKTRGLDHDFVAVRHGLAGDSHWAFERDVDHDEPCGF